MMVVQIRSDRYVLDALAVLFAAGIASAAAPCELTKIVASNGGTLAKFGFRIGSTAEVLVVADSLARYYVYHHASGASFMERYLESPTAGTALTTAFAVDGGRIVVGAVGLAYVFEFDGSVWNVTHEVTTSDGLFALRSDVPIPAVHGEVLVLGADGADDACPGDPACYSGAAYVFRWNGVDWIEEQKLTASDMATEDLFGHSVGVDQDRIAVRARNGDGGIGAVYVYDWNGVSWVERGKLTPSDGLRGWKFGESLAIDGDRIVVGATQDAGCPSFIEPCEPGAAYVFEWDGITWNETQMLTASNGRNGDQFGRSIDIENNIILVGAPVNERAVSLNVGAVFRFDHDGATWVEDRRMTASDASTGDLFGGSITVTNGLMYIASIYADGVAPSSGAVYMFGVDGDCDGDGEIDTCEILADPSLDTNGNLQLDICDHSIPTVSAWGLAVFTLLVVAAGTVVMRRRGAGRWLGRGAGSS